MLGPSGVVPELAPWQEHGVTGCCWFLLLFVLGCQVENWFCVLFFVLFLYTHFSVMKESSSAVVLQNGKKASQ